MTLTETIERLKKMLSTQQPYLYNDETIFSAIDYLTRGITDATSIPDGATNGDALMAMFPLITVKEKNNGYDVYFGIGTDTQFFSHRWWNTPFNERIN